MRIIYTLLFLIILISCGISPTTSVWLASGGIPGPSGSPGPAGSNGSDGVNGTDGKDGTSPTLGPDTPMTAITACGPNSSPFKEVLLCLYGGQILASFSDASSGQNTRFAIIPVGSYDDTDSSGCQFYVSVDQDNVSYIVSWNAGSNQYGTWLAGTYTCKANK